MLSQFLSSGDLSCALTVTGIFFSVFRCSFPLLFSLLPPALMPTTVLTQVGFPPLGGECLLLFSVFCFCYKISLPVLSHSTCHPTPFGSPCCSGFMLFPQLLFCSEFVDLPDSPHFTAGVGCGVDFLL